MAGVKGMKGGGGARPGAGRKPKQKPEAAALDVEMEPQAHGGALKRANAVPVPQNETDMLKFLQNVALGLTDATGLQVRAAIAAVQYTHTKRGDGGKREEAKDKANKAAAGRFGVRKGPPSLKVVGG